MSVDLAALRREYERRGLSEAEVHLDPLVQFKIWLDEAVAAQINEPNAMVLATVSPEGQPRARTMLLKGLTEGGFVFFTNHQSAKGSDLEANPKAALCFLWLELERQVRIEGTAEHVSEAESDAYFQTRPEGSRLGALVSPQSQVIPSREYIETRLDELRAQHRGKEIARPAHWGGVPGDPERN